MAQSNGTNTIPIEGGNGEHQAASADRWVPARKKVLTKEKQFTRERDALNQLRRQLPWERVQKKYVFDTRDGKQTLADLFGRHNQLLMYHFMFAPDWKEACAHCSFWADHYDAIGVH